MEPGNHVKVIKEGQFNNLTGVISGASQSIRPIGSYPKDIFWVTMDDDKIDYWFKVEELELLK